MKYVGALQPHRADSNSWNDSFGGHTIINNRITNSNNNISRNQNTKTNKYQINCSKKRREGDTQIRVETTEASESLVGAKTQCQLCARDENDAMQAGHICTDQGSKANHSLGNTIFDMMTRLWLIINLNMMRIQQSFLLQSSKLLSLLHGRRQIHCSLSCCFTILLVFLCVFTNRALCDETENASSVGPEFTTLSLVTAPTIPPFDNATRGNKKFGDRCEDTMECGFPGSVCDPRKKSCQCIEDLPVTNHLDKCGKEAAINESCFFNEQCEAFHFQTECRYNRCVCRFEMSPVVNKDGNVECKGKQMKHDEVERYVDPAMIGVLVGMALMFIIICVVLRLFSRARWRENRTIFNTPNPRLMNVSLLRDNKLMHGQERRGSRMSVRAPSRQPSMASLRPHSPNPSLGKAGSRPGSRGSSNVSAVSARSALAASTATHPDAKPTTNSNGVDSNQTLIITNIIENPVAESVTVEILQPKSNQNQ